MASRTLGQDLEQALAEVPIIDIHTHLIGGKLLPEDFMTSCYTTWSSVTSMPPGVPREDV